VALGSVSTTVDLRRDDLRSDFLTEGMGAFGSILESVDCSKSAVKLSALSSPTGTKLASASFR